MVLNVTWKLFFTAIAQIQLHVSPNLWSCFCLLNSSTHVVFPAFCCTHLWHPSLTRLTASPCSKEWLLLSFSLHKRPQPPTALFRTLGWAVHTLRVAVISSGCLYLTLKVSLRDLEAIFHVAKYLSSVLFSHTAATFTCSAGWPCYLPTKPFDSFPCCDDFNPPSHMSCLDHTVTAHQLHSCWGSAFIISSAKCCFGWCIMKPVWG